MLMITTSGEPVRRWHSELRLPVRVLGNYLH